MQSHSDLIQLAFTAQAEYISTSPAFLSQERLDWLLALARHQRESGPATPTILGQSELLDVACGAGIVATFMAGHVAQVTGVDLTPAVLEKAETLARQSQATNTRFLLGDVTAIPLPDASFDLVTCTSAFHHLEQPELVMAEVYRVLRPGGAFCAIDVTTSEVSWRREMHQEMERLRDPSHTTNLTPSAWRRLAQRAGLSVSIIGVAPSHRELEEWLEVCPEENKSRVRQLFDQDSDDGVSGLEVQREGDAVRFIHPTLLLRAEKPST